MTLETKRLRIREAELEDAAFFIELMNTPGWFAFIGDRGIKAIADGENYIKNALQKSYAENGFGLYVMESKSTKKPIGICGLIKRETLDFPDLGFAILPKYERKGYTFEASELILKDAKSRLQLETIQAIITKNNTASQKLLEKLGFELLEIKKENEKGEELVVFTI